MKLFFLSILFSVFSLQVFASCDCLYIDNFSTSAYDYNQFIVTYDIGGDCLPCYNDYNITCDLYSFNPPIFSVNGIQDYNWIGTYEFETLVGPGTYEFCFGHCGGSDCETVVLDPQIVNCADSFSVTEDSINQEMDFSIELSNGIDNTDLYWDFGDGNSSMTGNNSISHQFDCNGAYEVCLEYESYFCSEEMCQMVIVDYNLEFNADFTADYDFDSYAFSFFPNAVISDSSFQLLWDFGDGNTSDEINPIHNYAQSGNYNVCLTLSYPNVCSDTTCQTITIDSLPLSNFEFIDIENSIFPNPNNGNFNLEIAENINLANLNLKINNSLGQTVYFQKVENLSSNLNLDLSIGIYQLFVYRKNEILIPEKILIYD